MYIGRYTTRKFKDLYFILDTFDEYAIVASRKDKDVVFKLTSAMNRNYRHNMGFTNSTIYRSYMDKE